MRPYTVYIYPNIPRQQLGSQNPYIERLKAAVRQQGLAVDPSTSPSAFPDLLKHGWKSDMIILNWMEDLPSRRLGVLQSGVAMAYLLFLKAKGVKIIWIKHNNVSHTQNWFRLRKTIQQFLSRHADHILLHAATEDALRSEKTIFIPHPCNISPDDIQSPGKGNAPNAIPSPGNGLEPDIDLLVWGSMLPYKGISEFLEYIKKDEFLQTLNIHIAGKCDPVYWQQLQAHATAKVQLVNQFLDEDELGRLFRRTRFILFTYNKKSVLSSGVLMDSLVAAKRMIAPNCGAFRDMAVRENFVSLFSDFSDIGYIYRQHINDYLLNDKAVREFVARNSWYEMGGKIKALTGTFPAIPNTAITAEYPKSFSSTLDS